MNMSVCVCVCVWTEGGGKRQREINLRVRHVPLKQSDHLMPSTRLDVDYFPMETHEHLKTLLEALKSVTGLCLRHP